MNFSFVNAKTAQTQTLVGLFLFQENKRLDLTAGWKKKTELAQNADGKPDTTIMVKETRPQN